MCGGRHQEGVHSSLQPLTERGCGEEEQIHRWAAKSMLHDQGLPLFLCKEACNTAVYLQNKIPHHALGHVTPEEAFWGKKPDVGHFRIFGCISYSYVPKEKRTKLEPTAEKGICGLQ